MNREHYLSKRLRSQLQTPLDWHDEPESGAGADPLINGAGENKPATDGNVAKVDAEAEPNMKS